MQRLQDVGGKRRRPSMVDSTASDGTLIGGDLDPAMAPPAPAIAPADRLSKLPDDILAQILSLLLAQEAVRMCVLARTWRDVWKIAKCLLITGNTVKELREFVDVKEVREFVDGLLRVRLNGLKRAPLDACEIMFHLIKVDEDDDYYMDFEDTSSVNTQQMDPPCPQMSCQGAPGRHG